LLILVFFLLNSISLEVNAIKIISKEVSVKQNSEITL